MHQQLVHALAEIRRRAGNEIGSHAVIPRIPGFAAVLCLERAHGGSGDPEAPVVGRVRHDRVQAQPATAGLPLRPAGMVAQTGELLPGHPAVVRAEQSGRLDSRKERAVIGLQVPDSGDLGTVVAVSQPLARLRPAMAIIGAAPDRRAVPGVAAGGVDSAVSFTAYHVMDRPGLAERAAQVPLATRGITVEDESTLPGSDEQLQTFRHTATLATRSDIARV